MATEYYQVASSQGPLSLEASSTLNSSSVLSNSGAFPVSANTLSASVVTPSSDPWLANSANLKSLSLNDWAASPLKKSSQVPSLFEPDDIEARSWANIVPQQTPDVLKASFELKNSYEMRNPHHRSQNRLNHSSKLDAWSHIDPSVSIHSPALVSLKASSSSHSSPGLKSSSNSLKRSTASNQDDDETSLQRYKTELCKTFIETGICRYGVKCQFAHGKEELRPVLRHPKYKTEICKTFHNTGTCPYGIRCRFIHTRTKEEHQVFSSSASSFVDSDFELDEEDDSKVGAPPGIPVPQWSKSWTPTASPVIKGGAPKFPSKRLSQGIPPHQIPI